MSPEEETIIREFAEDPLACLQDWQRPFELARRLQGLGPSEALEHREAVELYCQLVQVPFLDFWSHLVDDWDLVKWPTTGVDSFEWAAAQAALEPIPMPVEPPAEAYATVGSMAWHLGCRNPSGTFMLPVERLGKHLGCEPTTVSNILKWLKKHRVIEVVDNNYRFGNGKGKGRCKIYCLSDGTMTNQEELGSSRIQEAQRRQPKVDEDFDSEEIEF